MTCKNCKWYYKEHCVNDKSEYCTENMSEDDNCKEFEEKGDKHGKSFNSNSRFIKTNIINKN